MKPFHVLVLFLVLPFTTFADTKSFDGGSETLETSPQGGMYRRLEALFYTGRLPKFPDAPINGYAGRCFSPTDEEAVKGAAYVVRPSSGRNGPLDPCVEIQSLWSDDLHHYDRMSIRDVCRGDAEWMSASLEDGSLNAVLGRNTTSFLRMSGNYYIEKIADSSGRHASYYCYYYLKMPL